MNRRAARRNLPHRQTSLCCHASALLSVLAVVALCGCKHSAGDATASPAPPMNVEIVAPKRGEISRSITLPTYRLLAYQEATLYAKVPGYLKTITVDKGDQVKEGQLLAEIEVPEMLADRVKYEAEVEVATTDYQRLTDAQKTAPDLVTPQSVDAARGKHLVAKANLERLETLLRYAKMSAPFSCTPRGGQMNARPPHRGAPALRLLFVLWCSSVSSFPQASSSPASASTNAAYLIDLPTVLRLAHAQNLDVQMAREKWAEAQADNESATLKFFPWLTAGIAYRRHDGQIQNTEGDILTVSKQSYAPGGVLVGQWTLAMPFTKSLPPNNLKTPPTTPSRLSVRTPSRLRPEMALRTVHDWLLLALKPRNVNMLVRSQPGYTSLSST